jgi:DNA-binding GntR family transcriptional regulator
MPEMITRSPDLLHSLQTVPARRAGGIPLYLQVGEAIERTYAAGGLSPDEPLPSERELALAFRVSRPTIRQALSHLAARGVIYTRRGIGAFVTPPALSRRFDMASLYDDLQERGLHPRTVVLRMETVGADEQLAGELQIELGTPIVDMERLRLAGDRPVAMMRNQVDPKGGPPLSQADLEDHGLHEILHRRYGIEIAMGTQRIWARLATDAERDLLRLKKPAAVLVSNRLCFDTAGRGFERAETIFPGVTEYLEMRLTF